MKKKNETILQKLRYAKDYICEASTLHYEELTQVDCDRLTAAMGMLSLVLLSHKLENNKVK